ncbi:MAG TPA: DUF1552 domain-containing protein [Polyangia bacterium]|nr:DUF1552 domain-containing protein [Polyangia bacterium]
MLRGMVGGGLAVTVPLPRLVGMLDDNGTAYAAGGPLPVRFGNWFFGNGIIPSRWVPSRTGVGDAWALSEELSPLQPVKSYISVVTGLAIKGPDISPHQAMPVQALTGAQTGNGVVQLPTIDQVVGAVTNTGTLYPKGLHVGLTSTNGGIAMGLNVSFSGSNAPNPPQQSPAAMFQTLLKYASTGTGMAAPPDPSLLRRRMVLDAIADESKALRARLGVEDQNRLDQHLSGLHQLQNQLVAAGMPRMTGTIVDPDKAYPSRGADGSITRMRGQAFSDLLVFAMAGDLTRVFSYAFTGPACHGGYGDCGLAASSFHEDYGHRTSSKGVQAATEGFNTGVKFTMSCLADTLTRMKNTPDGAGNLLDNSVLYTTSCVSESQTHGGTDFPVLVSGKAGGKLKGDMHVRLVGENVSRVPLTLLTAMGSNATSWGMGDTAATTGVSELLA